jgi:hypothetical protein
MDFLPIPQKAEYGDVVFEISYKSFIVLQSTRRRMLAFCANAAKLHIAGNRAICTYKKRHGCKRRYYT